ncbi:MAG: hypothetical protein ACHQJX_12960 [Candidatus Acidiferrales bacterium]
MDSLWTHCPVRELLQAQSYAFMLAHDRDEHVIDVADVLAGIYINSLEKIARYWPDQESLEDFVEEHCRINPQRWDYWIEHFDQVYRHPKKSFGRIQIRIRALRRKPRSFVGIGFQQSPDLLAVYKIAEDMAISRSDMFGEQLPGRNAGKLSARCRQTIRADKSTPARVGPRFGKAGRGRQSSETAASFLIEYARPFPR